MSRAKQFTAAQGSGNTIKIFDASTGQLCRLITTGGRILSPPIASGGTVVVTVEEGGVSYIKTYSLPSGGQTSKVAV
mgnify:CR=1 FL=1|jgi:hypothetical protein|tara:strand:- start:3433 stop:3663 length:231 start_codon:yes stop_codon:yes gene_type:complete